MSKKGAKVANNKNHGKMFFRGEIMAKKFRKPEEMSTRYYLEHRYLAYRLKYVSLYADDENKVESFYNFYDSCIQKIVKYMTNTFTIEKLDHDNNEFSFEDFKRQVDPNIISFLTNRYLFTGTVFLGSKKSKAHFYVKDSIIQGAEHLEKVFSKIGMSREDSLDFIGLPLLTAYHNLKNCGVLPAQGELQKTAEMIEKTDSVIDDFINAVCIQLILKGSSYDLTRAKIFAEAFGATFDFTQLSEKNFMKLDYKAKVS